MLTTVSTEEAAPCLAEGGPIAVTGRQFLADASLGSGAAGSVLRAWTVAHMFAGMESIFASNREPIEAVNTLLASTGRVLRTMHESGISSLGHAVPTATSEEEVEQITGEHYGSLFRQFDTESYWLETKRLLHVRLERNEIGVSTFADKSLLDAGCGGGRYSFAWRQLGANPVVGLDVSPINVDTGMARANEAGLDGVRFEQGDVLHLPFGDNTFDAVFSNGVLHHTRNWEHGIEELVRVLRPNGWGWLYVIENPGGLFWDLIELLRIVMKDESRSGARVALNGLGIAQNRIFYMLDHVMAPINIRLTPAEVSRTLSQAGAENIRRLTRGADFDRVERLYQQEPFAVEKFGVGENRFVFTKK